MYGTAKHAGTSGAGGETACKPMAQDRAACLVILVRCAFSSIRIFHLNGTELQVCNTHVVQSAPMDLLGLHV
jgi:hypothetical protein